MFETCDCEEMGWGGGEHDKTCTTFTRRKRASQLGQRCGVITRAGRCSRFGFEKLKVAPDEEGQLDPTYLCLAHMELLQSGRAYSTVWTLRDTLISFARPRKR